MKTEGYGRLTCIYYRKMQQHMFLNPGAAQDCIAEALVLDAAAVARSLKSLKQKGYLIWGIDMKNQRHKLVNMTPAGIKVSSQIDLVMKVWNEEVLKGLSDK